MHSWEISRPCRARSTIAWALLTAAALLAPMAWGDWPMFRHDPGRSGVAPEAELSGVEVAWSAEIGGSVDSSPAVVGGAVYVGNSLGSLHALSAADGSPLWRYDTRGAVVSSPAVADGLVLFGSADGFVYAVRADDGRLAWSYRTRGPVLSSPAVAGELVVFGSMDGRLCACRLATGELAWRSDQGEGIQGAPAIAGDLVLYGDDAGRLRALSLADGSLRWELQGGGKVVAAPVVGEGLAVFSMMGSSALRPPKLDFLVAVDVATGEQLWALHEAYSVLSSPLLDDERCYFVTVEGYVSKTVVRAVRLSDREVVWERQVGGVVDSSAALLGGNLCLGCHDGHLYVLAADTGAVVDREPLATKIYSSPAFSDGRIYVGANDGRLYCLE